MKILRSPMFICSFLLIIVMFLTFFFLQSSSVFLHIPVINWALMVLNLFSLLVAIVYVYWVRALEVKKERGM
ncbi:hypothetical protein Desku_2920 [Desulfofundulus kuznetsovii DSM 6115]|uniref:Uncharacterized protein n=1 Tax=Desulfofundulus kuznetsovii (strain DSM 6115 / VKM B-1805 / 17) TaxID=760568 RepID=A0AAU8PC65_DESK7|nr:hypothetical protein Desku_2920 [Desulfofundulus kuznetsovii DSM 6115]